MTMGVHNYKRWCDIVVNLQDGDTAEKIHPGYYAPSGGASRLWEQLSKLTKTTERGTKIQLKFVVKEGTELAAELTIYKPLNLLSFGMHNRYSSSLEAEH